MNKYTFTKLNSILGKKFMSNKRFEDSHNLLKDILILGQLCGIFPLHNVRNTSVDKLQFKWGSWKMLYTILVGASALFCALTSLSKALTSNIVISHLVSPLFYLCVFSSAIIFTQIAQKWHPFIKELCKIEEEISRRYKCSSNLKLKLRTALVLMYLASLCEHILSTITYATSSNCQNDSIGWEYYYKKQFHYIFNFVPYHFVTGFLILIFSWISWVVWNFGDIFIILVSLIMSTRFKQISNTLQMYIKEIVSTTRVMKVTDAKFKGCHFPALEMSFFGQIREDYNKLATVCKSLDDLFANLIIMCYVYNLSFILIQLFNSLLWQMDRAIERIYFFYSFGFVIMRTVIVSICAASVNDESKRFLPILNSVPTDYYNIEIQRLITQIHVDSSALTGRNFFRITRGLVLNVAAAIITYELVLIQFNQAALDKKTSANTTICL